MGRSMILGLLFVLLAAPAHAADVNATVGVDPDGLAGTDGAGRLLMFAPNPLQGGSSVSHFDRSAFPNILMEPSTSANLPFGRVDLTLPLLQDLGWPTGNSNVVLRFTDPANTGFNDPALGAQRTQAIQFAANTWGSLLRSSVPINVEVGFDTLTCSTDGGTLAQAAPRFVFDNFNGAPIANTWYPGALAESLSGQNLSLQDTADPNAGDLRVTFNSSIDGSCLGGNSRFYYGLDGNAPAGTISFIAVALHEFGHGLGFASFTNSSTGAFFLGQPDIYSRNLFDNTNRLNWHQMNSTQRVASAINTGQLAWSGQRVTNQAPTFLRPGPALTINSPNSVAGRYAVGTAEFGATLSSPGVTGDIVPVSDGSVDASLGCNALVNGGQVANRIALVDRGECTFVIKARNAQNAGARAVIIVNNVAGGVINMSGTDNSITVPVVMVSRADGNRIKDALAAVDPAGELRFTASLQSVGEGVGSVTFSVERNGGTNGAVSATYRTVDGTATAGEDFTATSGTVEFADGESGTRDITVNILDDALSEDSEEFRVVLENPTGEASLGTPSASRVLLADNEPCLEGDTVACLTGGRFRVRVDWRDFDGNTGVGSRVESAAEDSALYWFFEADNWEMLVKVIDGCQFNDHFWVFSAATTNVEYTLRITDTERGVVREYANPLGTLAASAADVEAFDTCP